MKTLFSTVLCITLFFFFPLTAKAEAQDNKISDGYTSEGIYYEIYEIDTDYCESNSRAIGDSIIVTREFLYYGIVSPPTQKYYYETISSSTYAGTLSLSSFYFKNGNTYATYTGTLTIIRE